MNIPFFDPEVNLVNLTQEELYEVVESTIEEAMIQNEVYLDLDDMHRAIDSLAPEFMKLLATPRFSHVLCNTSDFVELVTYLSVKLG